MSHNRRRTRTIRWILSVVLVVLGLTTTWAWGQVARLAGPPQDEPTSEVAVLYAAWQPTDAGRTGLFHSTDGGVTWQPLPLPDGGSPVVWADDGGSRLAVALEDGSLVRSKDRGGSWKKIAPQLTILSLVWGDKGRLYIGTGGQGIYRLEADGSLTAITAAEGELASAPVRHLSLAGNRLFAATPTALFYTDDGGETWMKPLPVPGRISALELIDRETLFVGTETVGVYRSTDAGQTWQPALQGLGLAPGQMVHISALRADPLEPGVLYAAVDHLLGSTHVHASAAGAFVTLDGAALWQPLSGPTFPEAKAATDLVITAGRSLYVQAVTANGLQQYAPDITGALATLNDPEPRIRAASARVLGLARSKEAGDALLVALADPEFAVSLAAADALGRISDPATASSLLVAVEHPKEQVRLGAARALGMMGVEGSVEQLRAMLLNDEGAATSISAEALGRIGSPAAIDALLAALVDPDMTPRRHAALAALEGMGATAVGSLTELLDSDDVHARRNAAEALGWIGSPSATVALVEALGDKSPMVRTQAAWALGEIGDPAARAPLERIHLGDPATRVQATAETALARIEEDRMPVAHWPATWAPVLAQLQVVRWLILAVSLLGAAWLAVGNPRRIPISVLQRANHR